MMRLWKANLYISCGKCNRELGDSIKWCPQAIKLILVYVMIRFIQYSIYALVLGLILAFIIALVYRDLTAGGFETSFTGQILIETLEQLQQLWGML